MIEVSLFCYNLRPFLETVGGMIDHGFGDDDWAAVSNGVRDTDAEEGRWFEYEYYENRKTEFSVAFDESGSSIVLFRIDLPEEFQSRIRLLGEFCWFYHWRHPAE